jgi:hypothetical protein
LSQNRSEPNPLVLRLLSAENSQWNSQQFAVIWSAGETEARDTADNRPSLADISLRKQQKQPAREKFGAFLVRYAITFKSTYRSSGGLP